MKARVFQDSIYLEEQINALIRTVKLRFVVGLKDSLVVFYEDS